MPVEHYERARKPALVAGEVWNFKSVSNVELRAKFLGFVALDVAEGKCDVTATAVFRRCFIGRRTKRL